MNISLAGILRGMLPRRVVVLGPGPAPWSRDKLKAFRWLARRKRVRFATLALRSGRVVIGGRRRQPQFAVAIYGQSRWAEIVRTGANNGTLIDLVVLGAGMDETNTCAALRCCLPLLSAQTAYVSDGEQGALGRARAVLRQVVGVGLAEAAVGPVHIFEFPRKEQACRPSA